MFFTLPNERRLSENDSLDKPYVGGIEPAVAVNVSYEFLECSRYLFVQYAALSIAHV